MKRGMFFLARLRRDAHGTALIEFAFVVPILLLLFTGGYQISDAVVAYRKVTATTRTIADLTTQNTEVKDGDLETILAAAQQVLTPYPLAKAKLTVTQVTIDSGGGATVVWSKGKNKSGYAKGSWFYVPVPYKQPNTTIIVSEVSYDYTPGFASSLIGSFTLKDRIDMAPRRSTTITGPA